MTEQPIKIYEKDEISLLDILVTLSESWKLLVFGPIIAGVLAGGLSVLWPKTYESVAIVRITENELALLNTAPVLDPLIEKFSLLAEFDGVQDDARQYLAKKLVAKADKKTGLATIAATANKPESAQELCTVAIDAWLKELLPKGKNKEQMEQQIFSNEQIINNYTDAIEQLRKQIRSANQNEAGLEVVMKHYATLTTEIAKKEFESIELRRRLTIPGDELYVQKPSMPQRYVSPRMGLLMLLTATLVFVIILICVLIRNAWNLALLSDRSASKIHNIKSHLGLLK